MEHIKDIIAFIQEDAGTAIYSVQKVILKAAYGIPLDDVEKTVGYRKNYTDDPLLVTEAEYLKMLHDEGRCNIDRVVEGDRRGDLVLPVGKKSGNRLLTNILLNYELYKLLCKEDPHGYYGLQPNSKIPLRMVAHSPEMSARNFDSWKNSVFQIPKLRQRLKSLEETRGIFQPSIGGKPFDSEIPSPVRVYTRTCDVRPFHGTGHLMVVFNEPDLFVTDDGRKKYEDLYCAAAPTLATFSPKGPSGPIGPCEGVFMRIGSPTSNSIFKYAFHYGSKLPDGILCFNSPTWEMNPTINMEFLQREKEKAESEGKPEKFRHMFGAEFKD